MVIKDGRFIFVGDREGAEQYVKGAKEVIDWTGKGMVMPTMADGHAHYLLQNSLKQFEANTVHFTGDDSYQDVLDKVRSKIDAAKRNGSELKFIYGEGYNYAKWDKARDCADLDAISADIPIFLAPFDQHSCWCNSATMVNAGILDKDGAVLRDDIPGGYVY